MTDASHFELRRLISTATRHVFATMLSMKVRDTMRVAPFSPDEERVVASVSFGGNGVAGGLSINVPSAFAAAIAAAMLDPKMEATRCPGAINDVLSELANVIGGNCVVALGELGCVCALGLPTVTRGVGLQTEAVRGAKRECVLFEHEQNHFFISLELKPG